MGYRITYGLDKQMPDRPGEVRGWLTGLCFCTFLVLVWCFWTEGRQVLARMLWPGDGAAAVEAAELFVDAVQCGLSLGDAAEMFCRELLSVAGH